jgi:hypothetical protein
MVVVILAVSYIGAEFLRTSWLHGLLSPSASLAAGVVITCSRLMFVVVMALILYLGIRQRGRQAWIAMPAVLLVSIGLFARELSALHIPSIWFPFGTGVSRTQFAYAAGDSALFGLLMQHLVSFATLPRLTANYAGKGRCA